MASVIRRTARSYIKNNARFVQTCDPTCGGHGHPNPKLWKNLSLFVGFPAIALGMLNVYLTHEEPKRPRFVRYEYLRRRIKRFPWGDGQKTLFHNPKVNALPDGYEDELEASE